MKDVILIVALVVILGLAAFYIHRAKKKGQKCIGCPYGATCDKNRADCSCDDRNK